MGVLRYKTEGDTCYCIEGDPDSQPVLVLIHGVGLDQKMWNPWRELLGDRYCIVSYDLLGHGDSANPRGARTLGDFAGQLDRLTKHLGLVNWHLTGFSLGALIALYWSVQQQADQNASLTLLHCVFNRSREQLAAVKQRFAVTRDQGPMATVEVAISRWFSDSWVIDHPGQIESIRQTFRQHTDDGYLKAYRLFCSADNELSKINPVEIERPCLVITGDQDSGSTAGMSRQLAGQLRATCIINPGQRHMAPLEHADCLTAQVAQFIQSTSRT